MSVSQARPSSSSRPPTALLVLGAPHCGGAAVARALQQCGAWSCDVRAVCDAMLPAATAAHAQVAEYTVDNGPFELPAPQREEFLQAVSRCEARGSWVMEDPRLCMLAPALQPCLPGAIYIHVLRNPLDAARAWQEETGAGVSDALSALEACTTRALRASASHPRVFVSHEDLISDSRGCMESLLAELDALGACGLEMPGAFGQSAPGAGKHQDQTDALERALAEKTAQVQVLKSSAKRTSAEINILSQRVALLDAQIMEIYASSSWRVTAPLRSLSEAMRKGMLARRSTPRRIGKVGTARSRALPGSTGSALPGEDTFVLYRIIGNDLYPRHARGQAVENLRFILDHEPALEGCEKRFVLNRIFDPGQEAEIIELLERSSARYLRLPFDFGEYAAVGFDTDVLPEPDFLFGGRFEALDDAERERVVGALYRHKNNYVMNNNGARNAALREGRGRAKWILPWDGNCFLTQQAWDQVRSDVANAQHNRYFVVPMARMLGNECLINGGEVPKAVEEPQLIFRADAVDEFNPAFCYGRRPKVELLWRLGVEGPWDEYRDDPWDQERRPVSPEANQVGKAGWVARLSSGMGTLETSTDHAALHRGFARSGAILATLQQLDNEVAGMDSDQPTSIRMEVLQQEVRARNAEPVGALVQALLRAADEAIQRGNHNPGRDRVSPRQELDDSLVLALAWSFTGSAGYVEHGSTVAARLFVDPSGRVEARSGEMKAGFHYYLDAVRIFEESGGMPDRVKAGVRAWMEAHLDWLLMSPEGVRDRQANDHRGTCHDLQVASVASFLDNHEVVHAALVRAQSRIRGQFAPDGSQPNELEGPATAHACCFNFQKWVDLAELASRWGVDLWGYRSPEGACLGQGARWLLSHMGTPWPFAQTGDFDADRFQPIWFAASEVVDGLPGNSRAASSPYAIKPVFPHRHGIRPFWNLASYGRPRRARRPDPTYCPVSRL